MNKEQQQIIDEAYKNYSREYEKDNSIGVFLPVARVDGKHTYRKIDEERFIGLCIYDETFSEKWGLKIEERELRLEEKYDWIEDNTESYMKTNLLDYDLLTGNISLDHIKFSLSKEAPTKLITITYNDKTIESYDY